jgi:hypothetical protein
MVLPNHNLDGQGKASRKKRESRTLEVGAERGVEA